VTHIAALITVQKQDHSGSKTMPAHRVKPNICLYNTTKIKQLTEVKSGRLLYCGIWGS